MQTWDTDFGLSKILPSNSLSISLPYEQVMRIVDCDWPLIIMGALSGYIPERSIFDYALAIFPEDSSAEVEELAMMHYESTPDLWRRDQILAFMVKNINEKEWAFSFEKLLYVVVFIFSENPHRFDCNDGTMDPSGALETVWADFDHVGTATILETVGLPRYTESTANELDRIVSEKCAIYLEEQRRWIEEFDSENPEDIAELQCVINAWNTSGKE